MDIKEIKENVLAEKLAIKNDCSVKKLQKTLDLIFGKKKYKTSGHYKFYIKMPNCDWGWLGVDSTELDVVNLSLINFNVSMKDKVIELRKKFPNDEEFKAELAKLTIS